MRSSIRLLIVEDHIGLTENLMEFFSDRRYVLDFAADGLTALHLAATNTYDVIVLDVMLPGLCGTEVCRRLRRDMHNATPIIMVRPKTSYRTRKKALTSAPTIIWSSPFPCASCNCASRRCTGAASA